MGQPIIGHLARKGFRTFATDLDAAKQRRGRAARRGLGRRRGDALRGAVRASILVCVGYDRELRELLQDPKLLSATGRAPIVAVLSTVHPRTVQELARSAAKRIVQSSTRRCAAAARPRTRARCSPSSAATPPWSSACSPVLGAFSSDIVHTGGVGTAQVAKAVNNLIMWACLVADHEGLALAQRYGVDVEKLRQALLMSSAANNALGNWGMQTMAWAEDDMAIVAEMAADCGLALAAGRRDARALPRAQAETLQARRVRSLTAVADL